MPSDESDRLKTIEPELHVGPEYAVAEGDVAEIVSGEVVAGTSLWRDARRRLLRNRLAVVGMGIVVIVIVACLLGPTLIEKTTGYTYDFIPRDVSLAKSFPPFRSAGGRFSWAH